MSLNTQEIDAIKKAKPKILGIGAGLGILIGLAGAFMLTQDMEKKGRVPKVTFMEWFKLLVLAIGLLRSVATLTED
jgi:hypothetical protein